MKRYTKAMNVKIDFSSPFIIIFICGTFLSFLLNHFLEYIDYRARVKNGGSLPEALKTVPLAQKTFDQEKLKKIAEYENAKYFVWIPSSICRTLLEFGLIIFGFYPFVFDKICLLTGFPLTIGNSFACFGLFLILSSIPEEILSIPFSLYREFVTEKKFGFSNMTLGLWFKDQLKEMIVSLILGALLSFVASIFFVKMPESWWFILCALMIVFTLVMQVIYPKFIAPIFNKFSPLEEGELKEKITALLSDTGFVSDGVFVMDASKRSGHSNAYFTGFGKAKRIVLYDTLIKSLTSDELVAVLGHELGHFKLKHILKRLLCLIPLEFVLMFGLFKIAQFADLYTAFGFTSVNSANVSQVQFIGLFLAMTLYSSISEIISPLTNISSRKNEYEADAYSAKVTGHPDDLINSLIKLNSENLSELLPPKVYVFWNFSHPTLIERIEALKKGE